MLLSGSAEEVDSDGFCCSLALCVDLLMVEQISQILLLLPFALNSPVVQPILAVIETSQSLFISLLCSFLIHLQLLEHVSFRDVELLLIRVMPKRLLLILFLILLILKGKPWDGDSFLHEFHTMIGLSFTPLVLLQLQLLDILLP